MLHGVTCGKVKPPLSEQRQKVFFLQLEHSQCTITSVESGTQRIFSPLITATGRAYICSRPEYNYLCFISVFARLAHIKKCKVKCPKPFLHSTVALGGHCPGLASSHLRIFASSWHCMGRYCGGCRSITSSHLRIFSSPDFLKPSPQLRIFASSALQIF